MPNQRIDFSQGLVTARDPSTLKEGELVEAAGCEYSQGSPHLHKQPGRKSAGMEISGRRISSIHHLQYDSSTDVLTFTADNDSNRTIYESAVFDEADDFTTATAKYTSLTTTHVPTYAASNNHWIYAAGEVLIREPNAVNVTGWSTGNWRPAGMQVPTTPLQLTVLTNVGAEGVVTDGTGDFVASTTGAATENSDVLSDGDESTFSYGVSTVAAGATSGTARTHTYGFSANISGSNKTIQVKWSRVDSAGGMTSSAHATIDIKNGSGTTVATGYTLHNPSGPPFVGVLTYNLGTADLSTYTVVAGVQAVAFNTYGAARTVTNRVLEISAYSGSGSDTVDISNQIEYGHTELYVDSAGIEHESKMSAARPTVAAQDAVTGVQITIPATAVNTTTTAIAIYRSVDENAGGYPLMYRLTTVPLGTTTYIDAGPFTTVGDILYDTLPLLYNDGTTLSIEINGPPPASVRAIPFSGHMCYISPSSTRLFYSLPSAISPSAMEKVPDLYYLEFVTPHNDTLKSGATCNGGRSLLIYFERYTMLVNFLPQASDPGVFDQRVTEYVSTTRGAVANLAATEITLEEGRTIAVAADAIGVWATDGVSTLMDWTKDLDWQGLMEDVTMSTIQIWNNPLMDRFELQYVDTSNDRWELHFFYGRMKQDADGSSTPLITGPHKCSTGLMSGWRSKHYSSVSGKWIGWSGSNHTPGDIYVEREHDQDDSSAYDGTTSIVPFAVTTGDFYVAGLGSSVLVNYGYPKLTAGEKELTFTGTFIRDTGETQTSTKMFQAGTSKSIYWHRYADRHRVRITDLTNTSMPSLVGYEVEIRGEGRAVGD